jgi:hypothetical protein
VSSFLINDHDERTTGGDVVEMAAGSLNLGILATHEEGTKTFRVENPRELIGRDT